MRLQTPLTCYLRFGPRVATTPARLATGSPARLWPGWTLTSKLVSAFPNATPSALVAHSLQLSRGGSWCSKAVLMVSSAYAQHRGLRWWNLAGPLSDAGSECAWKLTG